MKKRIWVWILLAGFPLPLLPESVLPFMGEGCSEAECVDCHQLTQNEAEELLKGIVDRVMGVRMSHVPGLYAVDVERQKKKIPVYLDFSKRFLITGDVIQLTTRESITRERLMDLNRIDPSVIPLEDAVVIGDPEAETKVVVFDDPECPYCKKIHPEMKKVVAQRADVAFFIKMLPLEMHGESARRKAKAIVCSKSARMLDDSLAGRALPEPSCETDQIEQNEAVAKELGVRSTPTLILPDGRIVPGFRPAERILMYLDEGTREPDRNKAQM